MSYEVLTFTTVNEPMHFKIGDIQRVVKVLDYVHVNVQEMPDGTVTYRESMTVLIETGITVVEID